MVTNVPLKLYGKDKNSRTFFFIFRFENFRNNYQQYTGKQIYCHTLKDHNWKKNGGAIESQKFRIFKAGGYKFLTIQK